MKYGIVEILTLIGSLGLFLYGMKMMSDSLQKAAGDRMRNILSRMTSNRFKGVLTGFMVTSVIQSSSATTVMVVSFVNAGLLTLIGSIGVIMGANIGTTVTAWVISLLGFKISICAFSLPIIALSFPFIFSKNPNRKSWGEFIIGFAILFIGLEFLKNSVPDIKNNPEILAFVSNYTDMGFGSVLIFLLIGSILTISIQSSSATMALTLVMCSNGWISFEHASAMVLGENIGTTITANLAALIANVSAKRTAFAHFLFNIFGVIWMLFVFKYFLSAIDKYFIVGNGGISMFSDSASLSEVDSTNIKENMPVALSIFHTAFNLCNTILLIGFTPFIAKLVTKIVKSKTKEKYRLRHMNAGILSTSELSVIQAQQEIVIYAKRSKKMLGYVKQLFNETEEEKLEYLFNQIEKYENIGDNMEIEIASYLAKLSQGELSLHASSRIRAMHKIIDNIESIFDASHNIERTLKRKKLEKIWFSQDLRDNTNKMISLVDKALDVMIANLELDYEKVDIEEASLLEDRINEFRDQLKKGNEDGLKNKDYKYNASVIYSDIFSYCETMGDHIINVSEATQIVK
ncbi:MAG: Na/Pi cotransporter family protein [Bacteroidota bacterium]